MRLPVPTTLRSMGACGLVDCQRTIVPCAATVAPMARGAALATAPAPARTAVGSMVCVDARAYVLATPFPFPKPPFGLACSVASAAQPPLATTCSLLYVTARAMVVVVATSCYGLAFDAATALVVVVFWSTKQQKLDPSTCTHGQFHEYTSEDWTCNQQQQPQQQAFQ